MSSAGGNTNGAGEGHERRRHARLPMQLDALLVIEGRFAVPCHVRDFCVAGMFVAVDPQRVAGLQSGSRATIHFALIVNGTQTDYRMPLLVARIIPAGLGVTFDNPDAAVLGLLQSIATPAAAQAPRGRTPIPRTPAELSETQRGFAAEFTTVAPLLTEIARRHVGQIAGEFLRLADQALFIGARDADNNTEQRRYLDGQTELGERREKIEHEPTELVAKGLAILNNPLDRALKPDQSLIGATSELSLIDIDEFEEFLTVSEVVSVLEPKYREPLYELDRRLSYLAHREVDDHSNPLGPAVVCNAFAEALKGLRSDRIATHVMYKALQRALEAHLSGLYEDANKLLVKHGILPIVEKQKTRFKRPPGEDPGPPAAPASPVESAQAPNFTASLGGLPGTEIPRYAPPGVYPRNVSAAPPLLPGFASTAAGYGVFGGAPAVYAPPSLQQAYSTAQTQLALRRQLAPDPWAGPAAPAGTVPYAPVDIVAGLEGLQHSLAGSDMIDLLGVSDIKQRIMDAIERNGGSRQQFGQLESDALEVIANLFRALVEDALLTDAAKSHLTRLQAPVHKAALMDARFFESTDHPVRQLLNRVAQVRAPKGEQGEAHNARVGQLVRQVNEQFGEDLAVLAPVLQELDDILHQQQASYSANVADIVRSCEEQQKVLQARREKSLESSDEIQARSDLPAEWNTWLNRCKALREGERLIMNANTSKPYEVSLAWVGEDYNPYVFVDDQGHKAATLTLQHLAMNFRRGVIRPVKDHGGGAVDRALFGMVNRIHEEIEERATHDELTGFLNRKTFLQTVERSLPEKNVGDRGAVLCQFTIDNLKSLNDKHDVSAGNEIIQRVAELLRDRLGSSSVSFGRLGGAELGVLWKRGGLRTAYKKVQACFDVWAELTLERDGAILVPEVSAGITAIADGAPRAAQLLDIVADACTAARKSPDKSIYVAGTEDRRRERLEQMTAYVGRAVERERLVLLRRKVSSLAKDAQPAAIHVLVSAEDRNGTLIPPDMFMLAVRTSPQAFEVDQWLLRATLAWMVQRADELEAFAGVIIPLSPAALAQEDLANFVVNELMQTPVPPAKICFEIQDQDVVGRIVEVTELVRTLREFGCRFVLDEFGSGQHDYEYVKELEVDFVIIQSVFIREAAHDAKDFAMAKSINEMVHFMGMKTIAKHDVRGGVSDTLREIGVDFIYDSSKTDRIAE